MSQMQWSQLLDDQRLGKPVKDHRETSRTPFHKDYDRLVFSSVFRRLGYKTQVHSLSHNDHVHNRLTHSLEVASVGRSLGTRVAQNLCQQKAWPQWIQAHDVGAIVQSACLAHDIGNPPFGHFGETAIRHWFHQYADAGYLDDLTPCELADFIYFEGNAQGLRTLTQLEYHHLDGGMRLTYATLGSFIKYPWFSDDENTLKKSKYGALQAEKNILNEIVKRLGLLEVAPQRWCRHPLVYLMEAADDICYAIVDLEDGVELGLLKEKEVLDILSPIIGTLTSDDNIPTIDGYFSTRRLALLRGKVIDYFVNACANVFIANEEKILAGQLKGALIDHGDNTTQQVIGQAKKVARERIFATQHRSRTELGASAVLETILSGFVPAALQASRVKEGPVSLKAERYLALMGVHRPVYGAPVYQALCHTMDFVSGMTDKYAVSLSRQLNGELV